MAEATIWRLGKASPVTTSYQLSGQEKVLLPCHHHTNTFSLLSATQHGHKLLLAATSHVDAVHLHTREKMITARCLLPPVWKWRIMSIWTVKNKVSLHNSSAVLLTFSTFNFHRKKIIFLNVWGCGSTSRGVPEGLLYLQDAVSRLQSAIFDCCSTLQNVLYEDGTRPVDRGIPRYHSKAETFCTCRDIQKYACFKMDI